MQKKMSRKHFLMGSALAAGAGVLLPGRSQARPNPDSLEDLQIGNAATARTVNDPLPFTAEATPQCLETEDNILGPFYVPNAPLRSVIAQEGEGIPLVLSGRVMSAGNACAVIENALVDVWQANDVGEYDLTSQMQWRGRLFTEQDGSYQFVTLVPGRYLNGNQLRPRHIHVKASAPGFVDLTTQLYFRGDRYLAADPFVKPSLVMPLTRALVGYAVNFDVVLARR